MALGSGTGLDSISHDRDASSLERRPEIGTRAAVLLGHALDTTPRRGYPEHGTPIARLRAQRELRTALEQLEVLDVKAAIAAGSSFEDIGRALGVSRSAAHRKHGRSR